MNMCKEITNEEFEQLTDEEKEQYLCDGCYIEGEDE